MDIKAFIESGKLESYVLGLGSPEERQETECMARIFPEVREELDLLRSTMEKVAMTNSEAPPASVKSRVMAAIGDMEEREASGKIIPIKAKSEPARWNMLAAASVALLLLSIGATYKMWKANDKLTAENQGLNSSIQRMIAQNDSLSARVKSLDAAYVVLNDPQALHVVMKGTPLSPQSVATVYWNRQSKNVYLAVNSLPAPPEGKQYQLWGIVNKVPVDLGVFDVRPDSMEALVHMKNVEGATTFAVTLEKAGGSPSPTLDMMYVAGNL